MAFNLSGLIKNLTGSFTNNPFADAAGTGLYPNSGLNTPEILRENWKKSIAYEFAVVDASSGASSSFATFKSFPLPINPQSITQDENFAINIKPTQGGTVVNHSGNRYKDLVIAGTTGNHPNRGSGGAKSDGKAVLQPDELRFRSGYEIFLELRNYFRAYYQQKHENPQQYANAQLVFKNFKDGEFLLVELIKFSMKRSSSKPFMYDYSLNFRVLGPISFGKAAGPDFFGKIDDFLNEGLDYINTARGIFLRSTELLNKISGTFESVLLEPLNGVALALKAFVNAKATLADLPRRLKRTVATAGSMLALYKTILEKKKSDKRNGGGNEALNDIKVPNNPEDKVNSEDPGKLLENTFKNGSDDQIEFGDLPSNFQEALGQAQVEALNQPRQFYTDLIANLEETKKNANDLFNLGDSTYNSVLDRTQTLTGDTGKLVTDKEIQLLNGFNLAIRGINRVVNQKSIFKETYNAKLDQISQAFNGEITLQDAESVRTVTLSQGLTLERLALIELGDASRWIEIAELNGLKPPYIVDDLTSTLPNVLKPGDRLLIPALASSGNSNLPETPENKLNRDLNTLERNMGADLKLDDNFDLVVTNANDLGVTTSLENAAQAILLKLRYEKGDLLKHPNVGTGLNIGVKTPNLSDIRENIVRSILQDARFESLEGLQLFNEGNTYRVSFVVRVKNVDTPIPIDVSI